MGHPDRILWIARLVPGSAWKDAWLERHLERCPECAARLATREETRRLLVGAADLGSLDGIWPAVRAAIAAPDPRRLDGIRRRIPAWRWMTATAGLAIAIFLTWTAVRTLLPGAGLAGFDVSSVAPSAAEAEGDISDVQLSYIRIADEPARAIVFKPRDANLVLIWAGRN